MYAKCFHGPRQRIASAVNKKFEIREEEREGSEDTIVDRTG